MFEVAVTGYANRAAGCALGMHRRTASAFAIVIEHSRKYTLRPRAAAGAAAAETVGQAAMCAVCCVQHVDHFQRIIHVTINYLKY